jgi:hypothetical protein
MVPSRERRRAVVLDLLLATLALGLFLLPLPMLVAGGGRAADRLLLLLALVVPPTGFLVWSHWKHRSAAAAAPRAAG